MTLYEAIHWNHTGVLFLWVVRLILKASGYFFIYAIWGYSSVKL